jgi:hypothetical protein
VRWDITRAMAGIRMSFKSYLKFFMTRETVIRDVTNAKMKMELEMHSLYYPGCTLYTKAKNLDRTARNCSLLLGFELKELKNWVCCGAAFPLAT